MATIAGNDLGTISVETTVKEAGFIVLPLPLSDSDSVDVLDLEGASKTITIRGKFTGSASSLRTARDNVEGIIDGDQNSVSAYVNATTYPSSGINTKVQRFETTWNEGVPEVMEYILTLIQASS